MRRLPALLVALAACGRAEPPPFVDIDGHARAPLETGAKRASVLLFITTDCPVANTYAPEINRIVADPGYRDVAFHLVHVDPDLTAAKARAHAGEYGFRAPILLDANHELVRATGASTTPEAVVIAADGSTAYRGRIDDLFADLGKKRPRATTRELRDALDAVLAGKPVATPRAEAVGCLIPDRPE